ncbi:MAG: cytochrome c3 family protein [Verrucomicrobiia bacterium]
MTKDLKLIVVAVAVAGLVFATSSTVQAKGSFVKGASCKSCHTAKPAKKDNINEKTAAMLKKYKTDECKNCHGWEDGKFTSKKK